MSAVQVSQPLSFFHIAAGKVLNYWKLSESLPVTWGQQNEYGRRLAEEMFAKCSAEDLGLLLPKVVEAMGEIGGIEIGFLTRIGEIAGMSKTAQEIPLAA